MVSTKLVIKKEKQSIKGLVPIYLRITVSRKSTFINTGYKLNPSLWNIEEQTIKRGYPNHRRANNKIQTLKVGVENLAFDLSYRDKRYTAKSLKDMFLNENSDDVIDIAKKWIGARREANEIALSSFEKYNGIIDKLEACADGSLKVHQLNVSFLNKFKKYLIMLGNKDNTIASNLSFVRAICNYLIKSNRMNLNDYPFIGINLSYSQGQRKYLSIDQIKAIKNIELPAGTRLEASRDIFMFCTQTGLRIGDALALKVKDFDGTYISYIIKKTEDHSRLKCTSLAKEILTKYVNNKSEHSYIFGFLTRIAQSNDEDSLRQKKLYTALINKNLKIISERLGFTFIVSSHWARHSLAVNGLLNGLSTEDIKGILNHKNIKTTEHYAKIVDEQKDMSIDKLDLIEI